MAEQNKSSELSDWIKNHIARYLASDGEDGYLAEAGVSGSNGEYRIVDPSVSC